MVTDLCESNHIKLQPLLSIDRIPADKMDIPNQNDISQFAEFQDIFIPLADAEVGLLIRNVNRQILQPHEVVNSTTGHYAYRTAVGWVINCSEYNSTKVSRSFLINQFSGPAYPWGVAGAAAPVGSSKHLNPLQQTIDALLGCQGETN